MSVHLGVYRVCIWVCMSVRFGVSECVFWCV